MAKTYRGWTNYETWRIQLEMLDPYYCDDFGVTPCDDFGVIPEEGERLSNIRALEDSLKTLCVEEFESDANGWGRILARDDALSFLDAVNWRELAEHMIDEYLRTDCSNREA